MKTKSPKYLAAYRDMLLKVSVSKRGQVTLHFGTYWKKRKDGDEWDTDLPISARRHICDALQLGFDMLDPKFDK